MFSVAKSSTLLTSHLSRQVGALSVVLGSHHHHSVRRSLFALRRKQYPYKLKEAALKEKFASRDSKPTLDIAQAMPASPQELDNTSLVTLGVMGNHEARKEILKRHIMAVDKVDYDQATKTFKEIAQTNKQGMFLLAFPYSIGIGVALTAGLASTPMAFHLTTAEWFNHNFVTTDVPEPEDLETFLEVGSWTWNWMEPPLGQISFFLLTLQYCRAQMDNLGFKPYTSKIKQMRGERLARAFPKYDARLLIAYSQTATIYNANK